MVSQHEASLRVDNDRMPAGNLDRVREEANYGHGSLPVRAVRGRRSFYRAGWSALALVAAITLIGEVQAGARGGPRSEANGDYLKTEG